MPDGLSWHSGDTIPKDIIWKVCFAQHIMQQKVDSTESLYASDTENSSLQSCGQSEFIANAL